MMPKQYIGITGFGHRAEVASVLKALPADRLVMVGVLMRGHPLQWAPDRFPARHPKPEVVPSIFGSEPNALNMLHFTPPEGDLRGYLRVAQELAGPYCHGFQLNMPWPDPRELERYKSNFKNTVFTITVQPDALDAVDWDPKQIARRLKAYEHVANYVLVDPSAGYGKELDVHFAHACLESIVTLMPHIGLVVAGALHADNVGQKLSDLLVEFPISTDAEGKLRTANDRLDVPESIWYGKAVDVLFRKYGH